MEEKYGLRSMKTFLGFSLILTLGAVPAWAVLGESEATVNTDGQILSGQVRDEVQPGYRLHLITDASGTVVREYVTPAGKVFAVSWQGPFVPNMQQLLGNYFPQLQQHVQVQTGRRRGPLNLHNDDFIFSSSGHMRAYHGRAYVPSLLPTNVSPEVVQ
jgi:hypothetical protein